MTHRYEENDERSMFKVGEDVSHLIDATQHPDRAPEQKAAAPSKGNTGHGWVHPRPDGAKARCGGPGLCSQCSREEAALHNEQENPFRGVRIQGKCPACGRESLGLGIGGYITCMNLECAEPTVASDVLENPQVDHFVVLKEDDFDMQHPLTERIQNALFTCPLYQHIRTYGGPPQPLGAYSVQKGAQDDEWQWTPAPMPAEGQ